MRIACRDLSGWFDKTATIVTPTPFLAGVAREQLDRERLRQGLETWERPAIYSLDAWLESCWHSARYSGGDVHSLLSPAQERALWHTIIEQEHPQLFDISATVRLARAATSLMAEWHIPAEGEAWSDHVDAQQFQHWRRLLRNKCRENEWLIRADLVHKIPEWLANGTLRPALTVFAGFEQTPPAIERIQSAMGSLCVRLPLDEVSKVPKAAAKSCESVAAEVEFAARRLRALFEENPKRSFALFVPELSAQHALVERTLDAVFFPSLAAEIGYRSAVRESLCHISSAGLLIDEPIIAAALLLLKFALPRIDHADAGVILRSPFIAGALEEKNQRALADINLRKRRELDVSLNDIQKATVQCPMLASCWQKLRTVLPRVASSRHMSEWSELISDLLLAMGWPGDKELTAREEQLIEQWKTQLSTLSSLGLVSAPAPFPVVTSHLRRLLSFPLERGNLSSPIQVLDSSQAAGLVFDSAIALGLSEETWPPAVRISALVPLSLQRKNNVPGSTSQSAREIRVRLTRAQFTAAPEVAVTFNGRLSALAAPFTASGHRKLDLWEKPLTQEVFPLVTLEQLSDGQAPPFVARGELRGGTGIIKAQSQCPFRAFSEYRLNARSPEDATFGFDARERGGFVHKALENVWKRLGSQRQLRGTSPDELRLLVRESVAEAVNAKSEAGPLHQLSVVTERERLEEVILDWLALEHARSEPFVVEMVEQDRTYEVPGLSLKLRVDRIDRLGNGNLVLIDYKSGGQTRGKLLGERPPEPQLLVYAASVGSGIDGIFFGQLKAREVKAVGFSRKKQFKMSTAEEKKDWEAYIEAGRENVEKLANDFVRGVADVDPIKTACDYCASKAFCRVNEKGTSPEEEE